MKSGAAASESVEEIVLMVAAEPPCGSLLMPPAPFLPLQKGEKLEERDKTQDSKQPPTPNHKNSNCCISKPAQIRLSSRGSQMEVVILLGPRCSDTCNRFGGESKKTGAKPWCVSRNLKAAHCEDARSTQGSEGGASGPTRPAQFSIRARSGPSRDFRQEQT